MLLKMRTKKLKKLKKTVHDNQEKYELLRRKADQELIVLEAYFGKRQIDQKKIYTDILIHLEAAQKELSYTGYRGVYLGLVTSVLLYTFNTQVLPILFGIKIKLFYLLGIPKFVLRILEGFIHFIKCVQPEISNPLIETNSTWQNHSSCENVKMLFLRRANGHYQT